MRRVEDVYDWAGGVVRAMVRTCYDRDVAVLDVGAGQGKYRIQLNDYPNVDACEIWEPYVDENELRDLYRHVYVGDVCDLVGTDEWRERSYDVTILGDVLEHVDYVRAHQLVRDVVADGGDLIAVVPYLYPQDDEDGNRYQRHLQDDLTVENMTQRYPELELIVVEQRDGRPFKGIYLGRA